MSSSAIRALIAQKEAEKELLYSLLGKAQKFYNGVDCAASAFQEAGTLLEESGTLNGRPFDRGKTLEHAQQFAKVAGLAEGNVRDIQAQLIGLDKEIEQLQMELEAALAREAEEARRKERERIRKRNEEKLNRPRNPW